MKIILQNRRIVNDYMIERGQGYLLFKRQTCNT